MAVKGLAPHIDGKWYGNNHYDISKDTNNSVSFGQLLSLISYCDLTDFSRSWSSTFRASRFNESLTSIKKRNAKYWHSSKQFIEIVNVFGISDKEEYGIDNPNGTEKGPYFCGLNCLLSFPSYVTRFCGPCSTSKAQSVAVKFADETGVILKVMNYDYNLHYFNCSWLSAFKEEEERVFVSGAVPIKIVNITIIDTAKQYSTLVKVLAALDDVLKGINPSDISVLDISYLNKLLFCINNGYNSSDIGIINDEYLLSLLRAYSHHKTQIYINLSYLYESNTYNGSKGIKKELLDVVFYDGLKEYKKKEGGGDILDLSNLIKFGYLLSLFQSLNTIIIDTFKSKYKFNPSLFYKHCVLCPSFSSHKELNQIQIKGSKSWITDFSSFLKETDEFQVKFNIETANNGNTLYVNKI